MTLGEKIKKIRIFRNMTLKELGIAIGFNEKSADNRMTQYETNYRVPKEETLTLIAKVLDVSPIILTTKASVSLDSLIQTIFWLEETSFSQDKLNSFLCEWAIKTKELNNGEITKDEYFEWKLNYSKENEVK